MRNYQKAAALMGGGALLASMLGGCGQNPQSMAQVRYYCPPGSYLSYDNMCHWQARPPPANYPLQRSTDSYHPDAQPQPQNGWWNNWGRDAAVVAGVGGGVAAGAYGLSKLRGGAAAAEEGAIAGGVEAAAPAARALPKIAEGAAVAGELEEGFAAARGLAILEGAADVLLPFLLIFPTEAEAVKP